MCKDLRMIELDRDGFAEAVRVRRAKHRTTARALAKQLGITPSTVCRVEAAKHAPSAETFLKLAIWLDTDPREYAIRAEGA